MRARWKATLLPVSVGVACLIGCGGGGSSGSGPCDCRWNRGVALSQADSAYSSCLSDAFESAGACRQAYDAAVSQAESSYTDCVSSCDARAK